MKATPTLELDWMRSFVAVADTRSFTAAGLTLGATQSTVSVRIRKLEQRLGGRLLDRNAHSVALTGLGSSFLPDARRLLRMHDEISARAVGGDRRPVYELAVSDHVAGWLLPQILAPLRDLPGGRHLAVTAGTWLELTAAFQAGRYDAIIARADDVEGGGEVLFHDRLVWTAARSFRWSPAEPLPLVMLSAPCGIGAIAVQALASKGIPWHAAFTGTGVAAVQAAVSAGFGVACLEARNCPPDSVVLKPSSAGLPALPSTRIVFQARSGTRHDAVAQAVCATIKRALAAIPVREAASLARNGKRPRR